MPYIQQQLGATPVAHYEFYDGMRIGRSLKNDIVLDDSTVSAEHAVLELTEAGIQIKDLNSTNGIRINGKRIDCAIVGTEDIITIGAHNFLLLTEVPDNLQKTLRIKKSWIPGIYYTTE